MEYPATSKQKKNLLRIANYLEKHSDGRIVILPGNKMSGEKIKFNIRDPWACTSSVCHILKICGIKGFDHYTATEFLGERFLASQFGIGNPKSVEDNPTPKEVARRIRKLV